MRTLTLTLLAGLLLLPAIAIAQDGEPGMSGEETRPAQPDGERGPFFRPPPERGPGLQPGRPNQGRGDGGRDIEGMLERAARELGLEGEEAEKFKNVMREADAARRAAQEELQNKLRSIREQQAQSLQETLTPEQMERFQQLLRGMERQMRGGRGGMTDRPGQGRPDPRQQMRELADRIGLNDDQRGKVERIFRSLDEARRELMNAARSGEIPAEQVREQMQRAQEAVDEQLRQVLTEEQFQKLKEAMPPGGFQGGFAGGRDGRTRPGGPQGQRVDPRARMKELGVDDETLAKIEQLVMEAREGIRQRVRQALESGQAPEAVREQLAKAQAELDEAVRALGLSDEQFAAWKELSQQFLRRGGRNARRPGGEGRPPQRPDGPGNPPERPGMPDDPGMGDEPGSGDGDGDGNNMGGDDGF